MDNEKNGLMNYVYWRGELILKTGKLTTEDLKTILQVETFIAYEDHVDLFCYDNPRTS